jgi:hypothetical protein
MLFHMLKAQPKPADQLAPAGTLFGLCVCVCKDGAYEGFGMWIGAWAWPWAGRLDTDACRN